jgi:hypothetical protein
MEAHRKVPDMRIGQIMCNFSDWLDHNHETGMFYTEDSDFVKLFEEYVNQLSYVGDKEGK